jgi:uncharacterized protein (UPF0297 family)
MVVGYWLSGAPAQRIRRLPISCAGEATARFRVLGDGGWLLVVGYWLSGAPAFVTHPVMDAATCLDLEFFDRCRGERE